MEVISLCCISKDGFSHIDGVCPVLKQSKERMKIWDIKHTIVFNAANIRMIFYITKFSAMFFYLKSPGSIFYLKIFYRFVSL